MIQTHNHKAMFSKDTIATAVALAKPGSIYEGDQVAQLVAGADAIEARGGPKTEDERRVVKFADAQRIYWPEPFPIPATPELDTAIDAQELLVQAEHRKLADARQAHATALDDARKKETPANVAAVRWAEHKLQEAELLARPVFSELNRLVNLREATRLRLSLEQQGA